MMYHPNSITDNLHTTHNSLQLLFRIAPLGQFWESDAVHFSRVKRTLQNPNQPNSPREWLQLWRGPRDTSCISLCAVYSYLHIKN